ncbi:MAG TPA: MBL fold metallo-hydrolase [Acidimicrobiales bacterium]|nr:MBL fold metallo-hydrolase [Acidimicrobiales bacterium]
MELTFLGAAETVTGSRFLVDAGGGRLLVDCGLFQGLKRLRELNWATFPVDPASIEAVLLTHAHIDHSGYLPALVRDGFRGPIWCTPSTTALARILLRDAAYLQEEDARYANLRRSTRHDPALPLYTEAHAEAALARFRSHPFDEEFQPVRGVTARFSPAGHILGAASVWLDEGGASVLFSGDLGRADDPVMRPPASAPAACHVVVESTYGNRVHPAEDVAQILTEVITSTAERGGIVLIPAFAVGRTQTMLHLLAELRHAGRIPELPTYVNSPMAVTATELFLASVGEHRLSPRQVLELSDGVQLVRSVEESKQITSRRGPMIVITASGMLTGGRVLHHLRQVGPDHRSTIVLPGYQAAGTRGQALLDGARSLRVFGEDVPIRARVVHLDSLSAHADSDGLISWLKSAPEPPEAVSVVHGEPVAADALRRRIQHELGWPARAPAVREKVRVRPR